MTTFYFGIKPFFYRFAEKLSYARKPTSVHWLLGLRTPYYKFFDERFKKHSCH